MSDKLQTSLSVTLPDDVLIDAARMFYPDDDGLDSYAISAAALARMRDQKVVPGWPDSESLARWRETDPVWIASFAMMFVHPQLAGVKAHYPWFDRLLKLRKERENRFMRSANGCS